jgi:hypothetical protein
MRSSTVTRVEDEVSGRKSSVVMTTFRGRKSDRNQEVTNEGL